jgi:hypothetical protein
MYSDPRISVVAVPKMVLRHQFAHVSRISRSLSRISTYNSFGPLVNRNLDRVPSPECGSGPYTHSMTKSDAEFGQGLWLRSVVNSGHQLFKAPFVVRSAVTEKSQAIDRRTFFVFSDDLKNRERPYEFSIIARNSSQIWGQMKI